MCIRYKRLVVLLLVMFTCVGRSADTEAHCYYILMGNNNEQMLFTRSVGCLPVR